MHSLIPAVPIEQVVGWSLLRRSHVVPLEGFNILSTHAGHLRPAHTVEECECANSPPPHGRTCTRLKHRTHLEMVMNLSNATPSALASRPCCSATKARDDSSAGLRSLYTVDRVHNEDFIARSILLQGNSQAALTIDQAAELHHLHGRRRRKRAVLVSTCANVEQWLGAREKSSADEIAATNLNGQDTGQVLPPARRNCSAPSAALWFIFIFLRRVLQLVTVLNVP